MRTTYELRPQTAVRLMLLTPFDRLAAAPWYAKAWGAIAGFVAYVLGQPFTWLVFLYIGVLVGDYFAGTARAHKEERYNEDIARSRALGKAHAVLYLLALHGLELVVAQQFPAVRSIPFAFGLGVVFVISELESWDRNREALGGARLPLVRPLLDWMRKLAIGVALPKISIEDKR